MHFGFSMYSFSPSRDVLKIVSPLDGGMYLGVGVSFFCVLLAYLWYFQAKLRVPLRAMFPWELCRIVLGILVAVALFLYSGGSITLDAPAGTAVIRTSTFGYPHTYRYPLVSVMGASVVSADQSDALRLVFKGGADLQLTAYNQMRGKGEAASAINQFLQQHGGRGTPY